MRDWLWVRGLKEKNSEMVKVRVQRYLTTGEHLLQSIIICVPKITIIYKLLYFHSSGWLGKSANRRRMLRFASRWNSNMVSNYIRIIQNLEISEFTLSWTINGHRGCQVDTENISESIHVYQCSKYEYQSTYYVWPYLFHLSCHTMRTLHVPNAYLLIHVQCASSVQSAESIGTRRYSVCFASQSFPPSFSVHWTSNSARRHQRAHSPKSINVRCCLQLSQPIDRAVLAVLGRMMRFGTLAAKIKSGEKKSDRKITMSKLFAFISFSHLHLLLLFLLLKQAAVLYIYTSMPCPCDRILYSGICRQIAPLYPNNDARRLQKITRFACFVWVCFYCWIGTHMCGTSTVLSPTVPGWLSLL